MSRVVMQAHLRNELTNAKKSHTVFTDVGKMWAVWKNRFHRLNC